jgi:TPR repeat protein
VRHLCICDRVLNVSAGFCYTHGRGVSKDPVEAVRLYTLATAQGNANAQSSLGEKIYRILVF